MFRLEYEYKKINRKQDIGKVVEIMTACAILHNFLIQEPNVLQDYYEQVAEELMDEPEFTQRRTNSLFITTNDGTREEMRRYILDVFNYV
jgi:hypothetical protein